MRNRNNGILYLFRQIRKKKKKRSTTKKINTVCITISLVPVRDVSETQAHLLLPLSSNLLFFSFFFHEFECKLFIDFWKFLNIGK